MSNPTITIHLLGDFKLSFDGNTTQHLNLKKLRSLFAYLALHYKQTPSRQHIAFLFWPNSRESQARTNLRQLLHHMRQALPDIEDYLEIGKKYLSWHQNTQLDCDVQEFENKLAEAHEAKTANDRLTEINKLESAITLYRADLFPECYDQWIEEERNRLQQLFTGALISITHSFENQGQYKKTLEYSKRLVKFDKFNEEIYRQMMKNYSLIGDKARVMRCYEKCVKVLDKELGIEPSEETQKVYHRLIEQKNPTPIKTENTKQIPLVGRENEWGIATKTWHQTTEGTTHFLLISGEAGIGKTRLAQSILKYVNLQGFPTASASCYGVEGHLAYAPVFTLLKSEAIFTKLHRLKGIWKTEISRLLPELLEQDTNIISPGPLEENWQRQRFFQGLTNSMSISEHPLLLFVDDLQWCDSETLEWLHYLLHHGPDCSIMIVGTLRSEDLATNPSLISFILDLRRKGLLNEIELTALDAKHTLQLAEHIAGQKLNNEAATSLFKESEGSPLFIVEMTQAQLERSGKISDITKIEHGLLPDKVQAIIQMRLSSLTPPVLGFLEVAAIIGRNFSYDIIAQASLDSPETITKYLDELCDRMLIREQENSYEFSHDKIREVILLKITTARERLLHSQIATALELLLEENRDNHNGRLAYHFEHADLPIKAITYYMRAGIFAQRIYANSKAEEYHNRALSLISKNLPGDEGKRYELEIQRHLSTCLVQGRGYGANEVQKSGLRVIELCKHLDEQPEPPLLRMLAISNLVAGKITQAETFGLQLLKQAEILDNNVVRVEAHYVLGVTYHWKGQCLMAKKHLETAIALYSPDNFNTHITSYAQDPAIICSIRLALVHWHLNNPMKSEKMGLEAMDLTSKIEHPFSRSYALHWFAWLQNLRGDITETLRHAQASITFSKRYGFLYFSTQSTILYGWALSKTGKVEEGLQEMREGLSSFRATGSEIGCSYYRALTAEVLAINGQLDQSHILLQDAIKNIALTGECWAENMILKIQKNIRSMNPH